MSGWTEERRKKQAEIIRKHKPWEKSTGPKTEAGKARSSRNAYRNDRQYLKEANELLRLNREFMKQWAVFIAASDMRDDPLAGLREAFKNQPLGGEELSRPETD